MASRTVTTLKFVGSISLGLLTGLSYSLSSLTLPTLLALPSASSACRAFAQLTTHSLSHLRALTGIASGSFLLAYFLSPRSQKHPYLLWTTFFVATSGVTEVILRRPSPPSNTVTKANPAQSARHKDKQGKGRQMEASYEVLGQDSVSEGTPSEGEMDEDVNGEEVRLQMGAFLTSQIIRTCFAGIGFAMSIIGLWGDGASDLVIIEM